MVLVVMVVIVLAVVIEYIAGVQQHRVGDKHSVKLEIRLLMR